MKKPVFLILCIILGIVAYFLFFKEEKDSFPLEGAESDNAIIYLNTASGVKYVGSDNCIPCHKSTHNSFSHSEMGKSMEILTNDNIIENYSGVNPVYDRKLNYYYEMIKTDSGFYQREFRLDNEGNLFHERFMKADLSIGSGNNLRMYFNDENGMFYQLPLTWYTNKKQWDLSPGYRNHGNLRFSRYATRKCITCHNAYLSEFEAALDRYKKPYIFGISCERCHGPGELHIREMNEEIKNIPANYKTIVNPAKLTTERQLSVCMQCHAQGKAWAMQDENGWFSFKPGQLLSSNRSIYYPARTSKQAIEVGESPYRLKLSRCFSESGGKLTCISCHNPHLSIKSFTMKHYNDKCIGCHAVESLPKKENGIAHQNNDDCISCHMNKTGTDNTLHGVPLTDHWIRKDAYKDKIDWSSLLASPETLPAITLTADVDADDKKRETRKGIAYIELYKETDNKKVYLDSALYYLKAGIKIIPDDPYVYFYTGEVFFLTENFIDALNAYRKAIELKPDYFEAYFKSAQIYSAQQNYEAAAEAYLDALKYRPMEPSYLEGLAYAYMNSGNYNEAKRLLEESLKIDKQNAAAYYTLGNIYALDLQQPEKAINFFEKASVINPDLENVFLNLGNTFALIGNVQEAERAYKKELFIRPNSISARINLARLYFVQGRNSEARKLIRAVLNDDPKNEFARSLLN